MAGLTGEGFSKSSYPREGHDCRYGERVSVKQTSGPGISFQMKTTAIQESQDPQISSFKEALIAGLD